MTKIITKTIYEAIKEEQEEGTGARTLSANKALPLTMIEEVFASEDWKEYVAQYGTDGQKFVLEQENVEDIDDEVIEDEQEETEEDPSQVNDAEVREVKETRSVAIVKPAPKEISLPEQNNILASAPVIIEQIANITKRMGTRVLNIDFEDRDSDIGKYVLEELKAHISYVKAYSDLAKVYLVTKKMVRDEEKYEDIQRRV